MPAGSGFDDFASLIESIHDLKLAKFEIQAEPTTSVSNPIIYDSENKLTFSGLDFEPKSFLFKCNGVTSDIYTALSNYMANIRTTYPNAMGYSFYSGFLIDTGTVTPSMMWVYNSSSSGSNTEFANLNNCNYFHKRQDSETGKWIVDFYLADPSPGVSTKRYYRTIMASPNDNLQVFFLG